MKRMTHFRARFFTVILMLAEAVAFRPAPSRAELINVDFNDATIDGGNPTPTYSGAAAVGSPGDLWNGLNLGDVWSNQYDTLTFSLPLYASGSPLAGVSLIMSGNKCTLPWGWNTNSNPYTALLSDYVAYDPTITVTGLTSGTYDLFLYSGAVRPKFTANRAAATAGLNAGTAVDGLAYGTNYTILHPKVSSDGVLTIRSASHDPNWWDYAISGFQLEESRGATWKGGSDGDIWTASNNWLAPSDPNGADAGANFGYPDSAGHGTVTLDADRTVNWINFLPDVPTTLSTSSSNSLTLTNRVTVNGDTVRPTVTIQASSTHAINPPVNLAGDAQIYVPDNSAQLTLGGNIAGTGGITKAGAGTLLLSGSNTYQGVTYITGFNSQPYISIVRAGSTTAFGDPATADVEFPSSGGQRRLVLDLGGFDVTVSKLNAPSENDGLPSDSGGWQWGYNIANVSATPATLTVSNTVECSYLGTLRDNGGVLGLTKDGTGKLTLQSGNRFINYSGRLTIKNGTLNPDGLNDVNSHGGLGYSALSVILGGPKTTGTLITGTGSSDKPFSLATGGTGAFQVDSGTMTLSGVIDGNGGLAKTGSGTLVLSGANTYNGSTTVMAGTLDIRTAYLADSANVYLPSGGKVALNFSGTDRIQSLYLNGVKQGTGTYGGTGSGATYELPAFFSGGGTLTVPKEAATLLIR